MRSLSNSLVWLFLFLLPTQLGTYFFQDFSYIHGLRIDYLAPAIFLTDILFVILLIMHRKRVWNHLSRYSYIVFGLGAVLIMQIWMVDYPLLTIYYWLRCVEIWLAYILARHLHIPSTIIVSACAAGAGVQLILTMLQFNHGASLQGLFYFLGERAMTLGTPGIATISINGVEYLRPYGTFSHPNSMGGFYGLILVWTLVTKSYKQSMGLLLGVLAGMLVLISFSKTAITSTLVIMLIHTWNNRTSLTCTPCVIGRYILIGALALHFLSGRGDSHTLEKRLVLLKQSTEIILEQPMFGTGLGHHLYKQAEFPSPYPITLIQPVHAIIPLIIMQTGLLWSSILGISLVRWIRSHWTILALPTLYILLTGSMDHYWLTLQQNMLLLGTTFGILASRGVQKNTSHNDL